MDVCRNSNGGCSDLCIPTPGGNAYCACADRNGVPVTPGDGFNCNGTWGSKYMFFQLKTAKDSLNTDPGALY